MPTPELTPFLFEGEMLVRTLMRNGEPWFVAADLCRVLGLANPSKAAENLGEDEKAITNSDSFGGGQGLLIVSESGLYTLIFRSRKPSAERFRKWVTAEVLPALRRTGRYQIPGADPPPEELRQFPSWSMEEMRTKRGIVDMYRLLYGPKAAQWVAPQLGFATPPADLIERGRQYIRVLDQSADEP